MATQAEDKALKERQEAQELENQRRAKILELTKDLEPSRVAHWLKAIPSLDASLQWFWAKLHKKVTKPILDAVAARKEESKQVQVTITSKIEEVQKQQEVESAKERDEFARLFKEHEELKIEMTELKKNVGAAQKTTNTALANLQKDLAGLPAAVRKSFVVSLNVAESDNPVEAK